MTTPDSQFATDEPVEQTDNTERPEDGEQDVSQSPDDGYDDGDEVSE